MLFRSEEDIVRKSGAWSSYKDERIGQGRENARQWLDDNPETRDIIEHQIRVIHNLDEADEEELEAEDVKIAGTIPDGKGKSGEELIDDILGIDSL